MYFCKSIQPLSALLVVLAVFQATTAKAETSGSVYAASGVKWNILNATLHFFAGQRSGKLPEQGVLFDWMYDTFVDDQAEDGYDLTGGFHDAGDFVKPTKTIAFATSSISWALAEYREAFVNASAVEVAVEMIRWGVEYLKKCHREERFLYVQVGDFLEEHEHWLQPSEMAKVVSRKVFYVNESNPASDLAGDVAAAFAAASWALRDNYFDSYVEGEAEELKTRAIQLFEWAKEANRSQNDNNPMLSSSAAPQYDTELQLCYYCDSRFLDEILYSGSFLCIIGYTTACSDVESLFLADTSYDYSSFTYGWDEKGSAVLMLMSHFDPSEARTKVMELIPAVVEDLLYGEKRTPGGLMVIDSWGTLPISMNSAFFCIFAANLEELTDADLKNEALQFANSQIDYVLGENPLGRSFIVGLDPNPPTHYLHIWASGMNVVNENWDEIDSNVPNAHVLFGAMVAGPACLTEGKNAWDCDDYEDVRTDYVRNEVALDYNSAAVLAFAAHGGNKYAYTPTDSDEGMKWWVIVVAVVGGLLLVAVAVFLVYRHKRSSSQSLKNEPSVQPSTKV